MRLTALAVTLLTLATSTRAFRPLNIATKATASNDANLGSAPFCPPRPATSSEQREIFSAFSEKFYIDKNVPLALNDHLDIDYIQHNPSALSGRQNAIDAVSPIWPLSNITLVHTALDESFGWAHYKLEMQSSGQPFSAVVDVFRFNGTCIMEHWDVQQMLPANATNPLALF